VREGIGNKIQWRDHRHTRHDSHLLPSQEQKDRPQQVGEFDGRRQGA
jgi:hypothetical protein